MFNNRANCRFILLPGAAWEIIRHIKGSREIRFKEDLDYKKFINSHYVDRFMKAFLNKNPREIEKAYREMEENCSLIGFLIKAGIRRWIGAPIDRITKLIQSNTLVSADTLVNLKSSGCNRNIYERVLKELNIRRSSILDEVSNTVDAHNFATVYALNEAYGKRHYFNVVTSSSIPSYAYSQVRWQGGFLHRSSVDVAYYVETRYSKRSIREIEDCIKENESLRKKEGGSTPIGELKGYDRFLSFLEETSKVPQENIERELPIEEVYRSLKDEEKFWNRVNEIGEQYKEVTEKANTILKEFLPYDPYVDSYEDFKMAQERRFQIWERRRSIRT
ncbi:MAG: hypothetical protein AB1414_09595 [bacterium]